MKKILFRGVCTAMITPMSNGELDICALSRMIEMQVMCGVSALCIAGTTGECATLTRREWERLVAAGTELAAHRLPVLIGVGTPSAKESAERAAFALRAGADALLAVTPYYNRGTEEGLIRHFYAIADAGDLPCIVYNVPGRTGVDLTLPLYLRLAEHPCIVGVKEAGEGYARLFSLIDALGDRLAVYTGQDEGILPAISLGADGVISVISNILPRETSALARALLEGRVAEGRALAYRLLPIMRALFRETSPAPIKAACELMGLAQGELRLPLSEVSPALRCELSRLLAEYQ